MKDYRPLAKSMMLYSVIYLIGYIIGGTLGIVWSKYYRIAYIQLIFGFLGSTIFLVLTHYSGFFSKFNLPKSRMMLILAVILGTILLPVGILFYLIESVRMRL